MKEKIVILQKFKGKEDVLDPEQARNRLEISGIPCLLTENLFGWFKYKELKVRKRDAMQAARILQEWKEELSQKQGKSYTNSYCCPKCGSDNIQKGYFTFRRMFLYFLTFGLFAVFYQKQNRCRNCKIIWNQD